jgi:LysR family glycine cleavage system transcriptional activator
MTRRLPPLNALRAFEAAARHLSFSKAADELHVTHGAISRAIRELEKDLGVRLFLRTTRSVRLTPPGSSYAGEVRNALDQLAAATAAVSEQPSSGILSVSTMDSFAARWLVPRLARFRRQHADIDVRLSASDRLADFITDGIDIAIRYGRGQYPGAKAELLMREDLVPVCSPKLLEGPHPLRAPADLKYHTLIHDDFQINWAAWLRTAGIEGVDATRGPTFYSSAHAVQAAIQGEGVVLGRSALIGDDLAAGRLVRPFTLSLPAELAYYVAYPPRALQRYKVKVFRDWLFAEAAADAASEAGAGSTLQEPAQQGARK